MKFFSFDYMEDKEPCLLEEDIIYTPFSPGIELAETVDLNFRLHQAYREITLVRVKNKGVTVELAFRCFAGITEDEEEIAIHLYRQESYENVGRTIRLHKEDNSIEVGDYDIMPCFRCPPDEESRKLMLEDWELKYGRFNLKERKKKR